MNTVADKPINVFSWTKRFPPKLYFVTFNIRGVGRGRGSFVLDEWFLTSIRDYFGGESQTGKIRKGKNRVRKLESGKNWIN